MRWVHISLAAGKRWAADNAFRHAAAVSFYTLFSLAPITVIAVTLAGAVFGAEAAQGELSDQLTGLIGADGAHVIEKLVAESRPEGSGWLPTALGVAVLLVGATTVFAQLQQSLNEIWGVAARPTRGSLAVLVTRRLLSFALVLTIGFLLLVSLVLTTVIAVAINYVDGLMPMSAAVLGGVDLVVSLGVITVLFAMIFKVLPDVQLRWRDVWKGALLTALLFSVGRLLISFYLGRTSLASTYGAAGSLVVLLMWVYYSTLILLFGAEFTRAYLEDRGLDVRPKSKAVRVRREAAVVED